MRILFVIIGLGAGGAERVMVSLANAWASRGEEVTIFTLDSVPSFYPLAPAVRRIGAGLASESTGVLDGLRANGRRISALRECVREFAPNVAISFMSHTNVLATCATAGLSIPTIVCEHNDTAQCDVGMLWSCLRLLTYPLADAVTFLTTNVVDRWTPLLGSRARLMPNPVVIDQLETAPQGPTFKHARNLIGVGRLVPQKGFDLLLRAFRRVASRHAEWGLTILGEGVLRPNLEGMIKAYGLVDRVYLAGRVTNPFAWLRQSDMFLMSSRFEGFPCSLCEAMACGLPAISFDCDSGPRDIIRDGVDGLLVPALEVEEFAEAMDRLMSNADLRARMRLRAPEVLQRFGLEQILQKWNDLFQSVGCA